MALENIVVTDLRYRWLITGLFGLMHGFGFSYGLAQNLQFAGSHLLVSLLSFNIGIEIGQILMLLVALPALALLFRYALTGRAVVVILSAVAAHTGWHWMTERADVLWKVQWPAFGRRRSHGARPLGAGGAACRRGRVAPRGTACASPRPTKAQNPS